jgi:hypothetical protein
MPTFDAGTARYRIEIDTSQFNSGLNNVITGTQKLDMTMNSTIKSGNALANNFKSVNNVFQAGATPLSNFQQQAGALPTTFDKIGNAADKTGKRVKGIGEAFRSNKGLFFGGAGLASAAAEAAGMLNMYGDAVTAHNEAQKKLAEVNADATSSTQEIAQAENEAAKAAKWLSMSTRNLVLSQFDQVFFATMVISQLSQMNLKGGVLGKTLGTLKTAFTGVAGAQGIAGMSNGLTAGMDALGGFSTKATATGKVMTVLKENIGSIISAVAGFAAALLIINQVESAVGKFYDTIKATPTKGNLLDQVFDPKKFKEGMEEVNTISALTGASFGELQTNAEGVGKRFLEMGGQIDKSGKIVALTADHYFTLGDGLGFVGKSSAQYIHWAAQMIAEDGNQIRAKKFLIQSHIDEATQLKILAVAQKDSVRLAQEGIDPAKTYAKIVNDRIAATAQENKILDDYLVLTNQGNIVTEQAVQDFEAYLHTQLDKIDASEQEQKQTDALIQKLLQLADVRAQEEPESVKRGRALKAEAEGYGELTSQADEMAAAYEPLNKATDERNKLMQEEIKLEEYRSRTTDDVVESYADEENAIAKVNAEKDNWILAEQRALAYQERGMLIIESQADEAAESARTRRDEINEGLNIMNSMFDNLSTTINQNTDSFLFNQEVMDMNAASAKKLQQELNSIVDTISKSQSSIADALNIKLKDKEKMTKKLWDYFPNNIKKDIKADIKFDLNLKTAKESIIDSMWTAVGADLPDEKMDKLVEKTIKFLKEKFGDKSPEVQKMINELFATIGSDDTAKEVAALMAKWEAAPIPVQIDPTSLQEIHNAIKAALTGETYVAPVIGELQSVDIGWGEVGEDVMNKLDTRGARYNKSSKSTGEGGSMPVIPVAGELSIDNVFFGPGGTSPAGPGQGGAGIGQLYVHPDGSIHIGGAGEKSGMGNGMGSDGWIIPISLGSGEGEMGFGAQAGMIGTALQQLEVVAQKLQTGFANLSNEGSNSLAMLSKVAQKTATSLNTYLRKTIPVAAQASQTGIANLSNEGSNSLATLSKTAGKTATSMNTYLRKTVPVAAQASQTSLANLSNEGSKSLMALAKASSKSMNGLVNNMKAGEKAVKSLQSAIDKLHDKTVTVTYKQNGSPQSKGGVYSFAQGGTVSAAGGLTTVSQPTHFIYGDNPGNHETLAFIPHNNPGPIMDRLEKMFMRSGKNGVELAQSVILNISGNEIVNSMRLEKKIRMTVGENRDRFG